MNMPQLQLDDVRRAWEARDPQLVRLICQLAEQPDVTPAAPPREGALTFQAFIAEIRSNAFHKKPKPEQAHYRVEQIKALEAPLAEVPLTDRLKLHEIIFALWTEGSPFARQCLLEIIAAVKLTYGPWRALKRIFKEAEAAGDMEVYGALAARFDMAYAGQRHDVSRSTLGYLVRRGWRYLRRTGQTLGATYADTACDVLAAYSDDTHWSGTWIANQIFFHDTGQYSRSEFRPQSRSASLTKDRAFNEAWQRTPRPLFSLLERAQSDKVRAFAIAGLKADFRASLREVEPAWVARLVGVESGVVDEFIVWILGNVPRFEQSEFRKLDLHETVLRLFDSHSSEAAAYAAGYARTHARDLPVQQLIRLANNQHEAVRKLAADLLGSRDARKEIGLEAWGQLLETEYGYELAATAIKKNFGAKELTPEWFAARLFSPSDYAFVFVADLLPHIHPHAKLGAAFFTDLIDRIEDLEADEAERVISFALDQLVKFDLNTLDVEFLKRAFVHPLAQERLLEWVNEGRLKVQTLPPDYFKVLAYHPLWATDPWLAQLGKSKRWAANLPFNEATADVVLQWMRDVRQFAPSALGFEWLLQLVARSEERYHDFAVEVMTKAFVPADFAPAATTAAAAPAPAAAAINVDFKGASFVFTGKLATMTRKEAEGKVTAANGTNYDTVSAKLAYLVIGDEGSPLYGAGKKGSKQVKAEQINAAGGNIKIISETAFLKMLSGQQQEASSDVSEAGLSRLWEMATAAGGTDAQLAAFARRYLRRHHPDIALAETDRPVDPGAEVPQSFLTFERIKPLLADSRKAVRDFALDLARWELARWNPPAEEIVRLSELPHEDVRAFISKALLADDAIEHRRYRLDPSVMTAAAVYGFVESADEATRELGMELIRRQPRLRLPEELFRLTESPDRKVRGFVIQALQAMYRDRGITAGWKPTAPPQATIGAAAKKAAAVAVQNRGTGALDRPEQLPAGDEALRQFLRRTLFELPPGRLPPSKTEEADADSSAKPSADGEPVARRRLKPMPARKAKLALIETLRDVAVENAGFARVVLPLLEEFLAVRDQSEHAATLVALTRVRHAHGEALTSAASPVA